MTVFPVEMKMNVLNNHLLLCVLFKWHEALNCTTPVSVSLTVLSKLCNDVCYVCQLNCVLRYGK